MAWRNHGRARVSPSRPQAFAVCDRCQFLVNLVDLRDQVEWRGDALMPTGFKVCRRCYDVPFIFNKPLILPPDPIPVADPRELNYTPQVTTYRVTMNGNRRVTMNGSNRITEPTGDVMLGYLNG